MANDSTIMICPNCKGDVNVGEEHVCKASDVIKKDEKCSKCGWTPEPDYCGDKVLILSDLGTQCNECYDMVFAEENKKHAGGRPLKFKSVEELQTKIEDYFTKTPKEEWTITGLALALDTTRQTLINYEEKDEYLDTIKKAKLIVENGYEVDLKKHGRSGTIFALKNFDWKDKTESETKVSGNISIRDLFNRSK